MKFQTLAILLLAACVAVGCGSAKTKPQPENSGGIPVFHPKYPDVKIDVRTAGAGGGSKIWSKYKDGYRLSSPGSEASGGGQSVKADYTYDGTTDEGDKYSFAVRINGGEPETKKFTYNGEETEIDLGDGMKIIARPQ